MAHSTPDTLTLVRIDVLQKCIELTESLRTSYTVLDEYWRDKKAEAEAREGSPIDSLIDPSAFEKIPFSQLAQTEYGVLTYPWSGMPWKDILLKLKDTKVKLFWIE